jgi:hypothetical protein
MRKIYKDLAQRHREDEEEGDWARRRGCTEKMRKREKRDWPRRRGGTEKMRKIYKD